MTRRNTTTPAKRNRSGAARAKPLIMALEPRIMFDGAAVVDAAHAAADDNHAGAGDHVDNTPPAAIAAPAASSPASPERKEVAFVDSNVADYQTLVDGIRPGIEVVVLDGARDGLAQMADWAATHSGYDAIHVLSHGSEGTVHLGSEAITSASLSDATVRAELTVLGQALTADGDLLIYGCSVASGEAGQAFIANLATITGADVAASIDTTGSADLGGDWQLEQRVGTVDGANLSVENYDNALTIASETTTFSGITATYYQQLATGAAPQTITATNIGGTGWDISVTNGMTSQSVPYIRGITNQSGASDTNIVLLQADLMTVKIMANQVFTFDFSSMFIRTTGSGTVRISSLNSSGADTGNYVDTTVATNGTSFFSTTSASGNAGFNDISGIMISWVNWTGANGSNLNARSIYIDTINVTDIRVPSSAPAFTSGTTANFAENATGTVYTAVATASSGSVSYALSGTDASKFSIGASTGVVTFTSSPNYESPTDSGTNNVYDVTITATDSSGSTARNVAITVTDVDEVAPSITTVTVPNAAMKVGDTVTATITVASDSDTYTLSSGTIGGFTLGSLTKTSATTYTATFTVTEGGADVAAGSTIPVSLVLSDTAGNTNTAFTTAIAQASDAINAHTPSDMALSATSVMTAAGANAVVGTLSSTDGTSGDSFTYTLVSGTGSTNNASFNINGSDLRVTDPAALGAGSYSVRVRTTDAGGNTYEEAFSVTVTAPASATLLHENGLIVITVNNRTTGTSGIGATWDDSFVAVALEDISANSTIFFSDIGFRSNGTLITGTGNDLEGQAFSSYNDGVLKWVTPGSTISAGSLLRVYFSNLTVKINGSTSGTLTSISTPTGSWSPSNSGDSISIYQTANNSYDGQIVRLDSWGDAGNWRDITRQLQSSQWRNGPFGHDQ